MVMPLEGEDCPSGSSVVRPFTNQLTEPATLIESFRVPGDAEFLKIDELIEIYSHECLPMHPLLGNTSCSGKPVMYKWYCCAIGDTSERRIFPAKGTL